MFCVHIPIKLRDERIDKQWNEHWVPIANNGWLWGKNVIYPEEVELMLLGSSKWNDSLFTKQPGCHMHFSHLDLFPRAESCSVSGTEDAMFGLHRMPVFDSNKGHLVMLSFWDEHTYQDHFSIMNYLFYITCQPHSLNLAGTLPRRKTPDLHFLLNIL